MDFKAMGERARASWLKARFGLNARISLYERLVAFLEAGIPLFETIDSIRARYQKRKDSRAKMLEAWLGVLREGGTFSGATKEWIPASEFMLISSGERGKGLISGIQEAIKLSTAAAEIKKAIVVGSAMPAFLFMMLLGMLAGFDLKMAPIFSGLMPVEQWPDSAQWLYSIGHAVTSYFFIWAIALGVAIFVISATMGKWTGPVRDKFDSMPPWSVYKSYQASSFLISLASMLSAGIALNDSLKVMMRNASPWMALHLSQMLATLRVGGANYGEAMDTGLFDDEVAGDLQDYSRLSSFENAVAIIGERMIRAGVERTNQKMAVARNVMLFMVAGTVFWIYSSAYTLQTAIAEKSQSQQMRR